MLKQELNYVKSRIREAAAQAHPESPPRPKTYSWTAAFVLRASFAAAKCVACVSTVDLRTRRNLGIVCVRKDISCDQKQLRSRTASTWIYLHAHRDMFLQNDGCDLAPRDTLMHTKMLHFRHGGTLGSQSTRKKTWISIMINKQVHAIKSCCVLTLRAHLDLIPCAMRHRHGTRLLRSHAASTLGSLPVRKQTCVARQGSCCASTSGILAASKNIFIHRCVRAPCVLRRKQSRGGCLSKG